MVGSRRRWLTLSLVAAVVLLAPGCEMAKVGTRCKPNGKWGRDATHVLRCEAGRWKRSITIQQYAEIILESAAATTTTTPPPTTATTTPPSTYILKPHQTGWHGVAMYDDGLPALVNAVPRGNIWTNWAPSVCAVEGTPTVSSFVQDRADANNVFIDVTFDWVEKTGTGSEGSLQCAPAGTISVDLIDANGTVAAFAVLDLCIPRACGPNT